MTVAEEAQVSLTADDIALLATARWENTPGTVESLELGKELAKSHPLLNSSFAALVEAVRQETVPAQKILMPNEDPFRDAKLPAV
jgi:hypothetical protein